MNASRILTCAALVAAICAAQFAFALEAQVSETMSVIISPRTEAQWAAGGADSNWMAWYSINLNGGDPDDNRMMPKNKNAADVSSIIMWYFDLSPYSGMVATADAEISDNVLWGWSATETYGIYEVISNWNESVTWENWMGPSTTNLGNRIFTNWFGPQITNTSVAGTELGIWTIPQAVVQQWLNHPGEFKGVGMWPIQSNGTGARYWFTRAATWKAITDRPLITIQLSSPVQGPRMPTNSAPIGDAINQPLEPTLEASAYSDPANIDQSAAQFIIATSTTDWLNSVWDSGAISGAVTSTVVPANELGPNNRYWWRCRYSNASNEWSKWSLPSSFITVLDVLSPVVKSASMSAMIKGGTNANLTFPTSIDTYSLGGSVTSAAGGLILHHWDLSMFTPYTSVVVSADGSILYNISYAWTVPPTVRVYELLKPWNETNVTWSNYVGLADMAYTNVIGRELDSIEIVGGWNETATWSSIDADLIQGWIDNPTANYGVAMIKDNASVIVEFRSVPLPRLEIDIQNADAPKPLQPTNSLPANGAADVSLTPTLVASPFQPGAGGGHYSSDWEIGTDSNMSTIVWSSVNNTNNLTQVNVPSGALQKSTRYYWRVRYVNTQGGKSPYSTPTSFDTQIQLGVVKFLASQNAMVQYLYPGSNWNGAALTQFDVSGVSNDTRSLVLFWFNLDLLEGFQANSDGKFRVNWQWVNENFGAQDFSCYLVTSSWSESTSTWDSFVGPGETDYTKPLGMMFGTVEAIGLESSVWTIAQASIQDWLDSAPSNFGLAIYPENATPSAICYSRRAGGTFAPSLTFDLLPEPAAAAALVAAFALLSAARRK